MTTETDLARLHTETLLIHAGDAHNPTNAVVPPIWQSSTYRAPESPDEFSELAASVNPTNFYSRHGNPTNAQIQEILAQLEGTETAMLAASGMGAISAAVLAATKAGDHVVTQTNLYAAAMTLMKTVLPKFGVEVTFVDQTDVAAIENAIRPRTSLIYIESPVNPLMKLTDLRAVGKLGRERGVMTMCDNTFSSPLNQTPHEFGIDVILHSATKYLGGHSDLTAGVVCGSKDFIDNAWKMMIVLGSSLAPLDSWLLLRGLRTLSLRVERTNFNAMKVAEFLERHEKISCVNYPALPSHAQHDLAKAQMKGFSGMMSFEVRGNDETEKFNNAQTLIRNMKLAANAVSLGGVETLIVHPASMWSYHYTPEQRGAMGISTGLVRLSVGIEYIDDLIFDFEQALNHI
jgi:cysteine-S-conjugate beta-lyase